MDHHDPFLPKTIDQQIEQCLADREDRTAAQQTVHALQQELASQTDQEALDRVWTRLSSARASSLTFQNHAARKELRAARSRVQNQEKQRMSKLSAFPKTGGVAHRLTLVATIVFLTVLVGCMVTVFHLASKRSTLTTGVIGTSPSDSNGVVYALSGNTAYKLDTLTHEILWQRELPLRQGSISKVINGVDYICDRGNLEATIIYALNANDGTLLWKYQTTMLSRDLVVDSQAVYYVHQSSPGSQQMLPKMTLTVLSTTTGTLLWQKPLGFGPAVLSATHGLLYIYQSGIGGPSSVSALSTKDGSQIWTQNLPKSREDTGGYVADGIFYLSTLDPSTIPSTSYIYAYDASTGKLKWQKSYKRDTRLISVNNGKLYMIVVGTFADGQIPHTKDFLYVENTVESLSAKDGSFLWNYTAPGPNGISDPIVANNMLYLSLVNEPKNTGAVVALDANTGKLHWTYALAGKPLYDSPVVTTQDVIVGPTGGKVIILQPSNGSLMDTIVLDTTAQRNQHSIDLASAQ